MPRRIAPYVCLLAGVAAFHRGVLFDPDIAIPWDLRGYHLPLAKVHAEAFARGELPLWDPSTYCGRPVAANIQAQVFYPPRAVTIWLARHATIAGLRHALELELVAHVALAAILAFLLARQLALGAIPATLAGFAYSLGCYFASQAQHLGAVEGAAWLPLLWLAVLRRNFALLAVAASAAFLCGFTPLTVATYFSAMLVCLLFERGWWLRAAGALAASAALCAVQLLPTVELMANSIAKYRGVWAGTGGGLPLPSLVSLVWPNYYNVFEFSKYKAPYEITLMYTYCGWVVLALAVWALRANWRFAVLIAIATLLMLGDSTPFGIALSAAWPHLLRGAIYPHHWLAPFSLAVSLLAAHGLAGGLSKIPRPRVAAAVAALAAIDLIAVSSSRPFNAQSLRAEPGITETAFDGDPVALRTLRALVATASPPWRIDTVDDSAAWMMSAPLTGIPAANGYDPFALDRYMEARLHVADGERWGAYYQVDKPGVAALDTFSVRYLLSRRPLPGEELAVALPGRYVYENRDAKPRFELAGGTVTTASYQPHRVVLRTNAAADTYLTTSEVHYPGWRAFIDGAQVPIEYVNTAFRGMRMPAGEHTVEMRFEAPWMMRGAVVSAVSWALLLLFVARKRRDVIQ